MEADDGDNEDGELFGFTTYAGWREGDLQDTFLECRQLSDCPAALASLTRLGVPGTDRTGLWPPAVDEVHIHRGRFVFCRHTSYAQRQTLIILPIFNRDCDLVDLAAWRPGAVGVALYRGKAAMLGEENLFAVPPPDGLPVHSSTLEWLRSKRDGIFILDYERAAHELTGRKMSITSVAIVERLRKITAGAARREAA